MAPSNICLGPPVCTGFAVLVALLLVAPPLWLRSTDRPPLRHHRFEFVDWRTSFVAVIALVLPARRSFLCNSLAHRLQHVCRLETTWLGVASRHRWLASRVCSNYRPPCNTTTLVCSCGVPRHQRRCGPVTTNGGKQQWRRCGGGDLVVLRRMREK